MLTQEKTTQIAEYLNADEARANKIAEMDVAEAAAAMQADGVEITAADLKEFADTVAKEQGKGELDEASLEGVSGGAVALGPAFGPVVAYAVVRYAVRHGW